MKTRSWSWAGAVAALLVSAPNVHALDSPAASQGRTGDQAFLTQALGTNELELQLGRLAINRATTPEVKAMGQKMVKKHTEFGQQLSDAAKRRGMSGEAEMSNEQRDTFARVESQSGPQFDKTFKQTVDAGHVQELAMYRDAAGRAEDPQLRALAQHRVTELQGSMAPPMGTGSGK